MPVYVYETIPSTSAEATERFEVRQSMSDASLSTHPETGAPVRRVLTGGLATFTGGRAAGPPQGATQGCGAGCGCVS